MSSLSSSQASLRELICGYPGSVGSKLVCFRVRKRFLACRGITFAAEKAQAGNLNVLVPVAVPNTCTQHPTDHRIQQPVPGYAYPARGTSSCQCRGKHANSASTTNPGTSGHGGTGSRKSCMWKEGIASQVDSDAFGVHHDTNRSTMPHISITNTS